MRKLFRNSVLTLIALFSFQSYAQEKSSRDFDNFRARDLNGVTQFEPKKDTTSNFDGLKVRIGGASTLQFQALDHKNAAVSPTGEDINLIKIGDNFNLATANLDLDVHLAPGLQMHLRTYLSSRHHPEPYVKGGYIQIDKLDFISEGLLENLMNKMRIKIGHMENNYGDAHFRRSDNAQAIYNPFVGNLIMDAFTTEVGAEVYYFDRGFLGMIGVTNGKLNQAVNNPDTTDPSLILKLGYDDMVNEDLRLRLTGSLYHTNKSANAYLYSGDRAGSRYYLVMEPEDATSAGNFRSGRFDPGFRNELTAIMFNPFIKYKGLEFMGTLEFISGKADAETDTRSFTQYAGEAIYRFGKTENIYLGARYNLVDGEIMGGHNIDISRFNISAGWFMTKNVLAKVEYVNQKYNGFPTDNILHDGKFDGLMLEAVISF